jgi:hypothetical protein
LIIYVHNMKSLSAGRASILALFAAVVVSTFLLGNSITPASAVAEKVYVCKYVGTPGVDETLQTGNNPIEVSVNALPNGWSIGGFFNDNQGRSFVLATVPQDPEPDVNDCPPPSSGSPTPTATATATPTATPSETPTATPTPVSTPGLTDAGPPINNGGPAGQVLGTSTSAMAATGSFAETLYQAIMGLGGILSLKGFKKLKVSKKK